MGCCCLLKSTPVCWNCLAHPDNLLLLELPSIVNNLLLLWMILLYLTKQFMCKSHKHLSGLQWCPRSTEVGVRVRVRVREESRIYFENTGFEWTEMGIYPGRDSREPCTRILSNMHTQQQFDVTNLPVFVGGGNQRLLMKPMQTWGERVKLCTDSNLNSGSNWRPWSCEAATLSTTFRPE